jgi:uncharacterized membrane protein YkvA (DUF1232 family)
MVWDMLIGGVAGLVLTWLALVAGLWVAMHRFDQAGLRDALWMLPELTGLLQRLAADPTVPRRVQIRLWLSLGYLLIPIDLVPDAVPTLGYADDAIIAALALRSVLRHAGPQAIDQHWHGSPAGLAAVLKFLNGRRAVAVPLHNRSR